jgi:CubicO group peptidase (beta-lactamase class C family)
VWLNVGMVGDGRSKTSDLDAKRARLEALSRELVADGVAEAVAVGAFDREGFETIGGQIETFFDLASLTKPMTALAFVRSGIPKETRLGELVPELSRGKCGDVSMELLLAHRAGVPAHIALFAPLLEGRELRLHEALEVAAASRRDDAPEHGDEGHAPVYSDVGYVLAGVALARALGLPDAGAVIEEWVARPLGLEDVLGTARGLRARAVEFERRVARTEVVAFRGGEVRGVVHDENAWALTGEGGSGHAGAFGTVQAVLSLARAVLGGVVEELEYDPLGLRGRVDWLVRERPGGTLRAGFDGKSEGASSAGTVLGPRTFGHLGFTGTSFWVDPDACVGVTLLTNRVYPTRDNATIRAARPRAHDALARLALGRP